jgi:hypothetical protein
MLYGFPTDVMTMNATDMAACIAKVEAETQKQ